MKDSDIDVLRSLTRLLVGASLIGIDQLREQVARWETATLEALTPPADDATDVSNPTELANQNVSDASVVDEWFPSAESSAPEPEHALSPLAYALIGCLFETQTRLSQTLQTAEQLGNTVAVALLPVHAELRTNPTWAPLYQRFDDLVLRGEHEVARWVVLGQQEHRHSQLLLKNALRISAETSIQQVVQNPEIQDLVQQQSVGLASEMVEEVREHAVSTDTFLERFVRHVLKRPQREDLPPPPVEVRLSAARLKTSEG